MNIKKITRLIVVCLMGLFVIGTIGCKKEGCTDKDAENYDADAKDDDGSCIKAYPLTQAELNASTNFINKINGAGSGTAAANAIAHGCPPPATIDSTWRHIYSNKSTITSFSYGDMITKRTFDLAGNLCMTFAMVRGTDGYNTSGGDWMYYKMPYDATVDYSTNPNGLLTSSSVESGKIASCAGCHGNADGGDYIFIND